MVLYLRRPVADGVDLEAVARGLRRGDPGVERGLLLDEQPGVRAAGRDVGLPERGGLRAERA